MAQDSSTTESVKWPWRAEVTPNLWLLGLKSDDQFGSQPTSISLPLGKILRSVKNLALDEVAVRKGPVFVFAEGLYTHLDVSSLVASSPSTPASVQAAYATTAAGFEAMKVQVPLPNGHPMTVSLQPFAGASYTDVAITTAATGTVAANRLAQQWWMPVVGGVVYGQSGPYIVRLQGDSAHFGLNRAGEQVLGVVGYVLDKPRAGNPTLQVGYRYIFEREAFAVESTLRTKLKGPIVAVTFHIR